MTLRRPSQVHAQLSSTARTDGRRGRCTQIGDAHQGELLDTFGASTPRRLLPVSPSTYFAAERKAWSILCVLVFPRADYDYSKSSPCSNGHAPLGSLTHGWQEGPAHAHRRYTLTRAVRTKASCSILRSIHASSTSSTHAHQSRAQQVYQRPYPRYLCSAPATTLRSPCRAQTHTRMAGGAATSKAQAGDVRAQEVRRSTHASTPGRPRLESPRQTWTQAPRHEHRAYAQPTARALVPRVHVPCAPCVSFLFCCPVFRLTYTHTHACARAHALLAAHCLPACLSACFAFALLRSRTRAFDTCTYIHTSLSSSLLLSFQIYEQYR